jgi:hypothetical protein
MIFYIDEDARGVFERLSNQVDAFRALAVLTNTYASETRHADVDLLAGIIALVRAQERQVGGVAGDLERIQKTWQAKQAKRDGLGAKSPWLTEPLDAVRHGRRTGRAKRGAETVSASRRESVRKKSKT